MARQSIVHGEDDYSSTAIRVVRGSPRSTDQAFEGRLVDGFDPTLPNRLTGLWIWAGGTDRDDVSEHVDPRSPVVAYSGGASHSDRVLTIYHQAGSNEDDQTTLYTWYFREWA